MAEDEGNATGPRVLRLRFAGTCRGCGVELAKGADAWWWAADRSVECQACRTGTDTLAVSEPGNPGDEAVANEPPPVASTAGRSVQREYERRATRERSRQEAAVGRDQKARIARREGRPVLGRLVNALTERPSDPRETSRQRQAEAVASWSDLRGDRCVTSSSWARTAWPGPAPIARSHHGHEHIGRHGSMAAGEAC